MIPLIDPFIKNYRIICIRIFFSIQSFCFGNSDVRYISTSIKIYLGPRNFSVKPLNIHCFPRMCQETYMFYFAFFIFAFLKEFVSLFRFSLKLSKVAVTFCLLILVFGLSKCSEKSLEASSEDSVFK